MHRQIQLLLLFLSIFIFNFITAQNAKLDSLEYLLKIHKTEDTTKANLINAIVRNVYKKDAGKAQDYANKAIKYSTT